ncbi:MAG: CoA-transferase [Limnohabitans sp.]
MQTKFMTAHEAAQLINDGDTVGLMGGGGGLMEATHMFEAIQERFLTTQRPRNLTVMHALGIGDKKTKGMNCLAHEGLVKRVIGGHWVWSPAMQQLALSNKIEAYILPGGVSSQLMREIGAGRPGLISHVGLGTVCDPRHGGGRMNDAAKDDLADVIKIDGREYLRYKPFPIHVAIVRASSADEDGNISFEHEAANLDAQSLALAAHNSGGKVIVQVKERLPKGALKAREVRIPSAWVDAIVVDPQQSTSYAITFDPAFSGELTGAERMASEALDHAREVAAAQQAFSERQAVARRAYQELFNTGKARPVINYGVGVPDAVAKLIAARNEQHRIYQTIEHGTYGGTLMDGMLFGYARNARPCSMLPHSSTFTEVEAWTSLSWALASSTKKVRSTSRAWAASRSVPVASSTSRRTHVKWCSVAPWRPKASNCKPAMARCVSSRKAPLKSSSRKSIRSPFQALKVWCAGKRCFT